MGGERGPEAMAVDREQTGGDQRCFNYGGFGHMAQNYNLGENSGKE